MFKHKLKCVFINIAGFSALLLGTAGIVMPLLPTTPFILLAVICFSTTNPKRAAKLRKSRIFGPYLKNWYEGTGVSRGYKIRVLIFLWLGIGTSMYLTEPIWLTMLLGLIGLCVSVHIFLLRPNR